MVQPYIFQLLSAICEHNIELSLFQVVLKVESMKNHSAVFCTVFLFPIVLPYYSNEVCFNIVQVICVS